jgi:hypothetical protein
MPSFQATLPGKPDQMTPICATDPDVFKAIGPYMVDEGSDTQLRDVIGMHVAQVVYRKKSNSSGSFRAVTAVSDLMPCARRARGVALAASLHTKTCRQSS